MQQNPLKSVLAHKNYRNFTTVPPQNVSRPFPLAVFLFGIITGGIIFKPEKKKEYLPKTYKESKNDYLKDTTEGEMKLYVNFLNSMDEKYAKKEQSAQTNGLIVSESSEMAIVCKEIITKLEAAIKVISSIPPKKESVVSEAERQLQELIQKPDENILPVHVEKLVLINSQEPALHASLDGKLYISTGLFNMVKNEDQLASAIVFQLMLLSSRKKKENKKTDFKPFLVKYALNKADRRSKKVLIEAGFDHTVYNEFWRAMNYFRYDIPFGPNTYFRFKNQRKYDKILAYRTKRGNRDKSKEQNSYSFPFNLFSTPAEPRPHADFWHGIQDHQVRV
eukprot:Phypoly_transcript_09380.p1 GENE.Phypoly_transcript_09380~~Phypoly_transcript_09380.p1  ORF type:complete len:335 (+),score=49.36 Phypoly_transcript_09380:309-1313(+)